MRTSALKTNSGRVMRLLVATQIFRKTSQEPEKFANNSMSQSMVKNSPLKDYVDLYATEWYAGTNNFLGCMRDPSHDVRDAAVAKDTIFNDGKSAWWQYMDKHPARNNVFASAMAGTSVVTTAIVIEDYPWDRHESVVDVGSGIGNLTLALRNKFPSMEEVTLQDRESVLDQARVIWPSDAKGVELKIHDFFEPNPTVGKDGV